MQIKFCLDYYPNQRYLNDADELKIKYRPTDPTLREFIQHYIEKTISIDVSNAFDQIDADMFKNLRRVYKNFKLIIDFNNKEYLERAQKYELPFFFSNYVGTIDEMYGLMAYNPTDIYICEQLGFNLDRVSKVLHDNDIKVRVIPNICQSSFPETPSIKTFFIRPEDIPVYAQFVDVFELFSDSIRQRVIFKVYRQQKWFGQIKEIIPSFKDDLDSRYMLTTFGMIRSRCGKRCMYRPGTCDICERFRDLAQSFEKAHIVVKHVKKGAAGGGSDKPDQEIAEAETPQSLPETMEEKPVPYPELNDYDDDEDIDEDEEQEEEEELIPPREETKEEREYRLAMEADEGFLDETSFDNY